MFDLEFVLRRVWRRVAMLPEGLGEEVPLPVGLELQEDIVFERGDDINDLLVQPFLGAVRQLGLLRIRVGEGTEAEDGRAQDEGRTMFHPATPLDQIQRTNPKY
jgi:hypothetical protein